MVKIQATLLVGDRCNNECALCRFMDKKCPHRGIPDIEQELQKLRKEVYSEVILVGGEVLLREDIFDIIKLVKAYGFKPWIESNGRVLAYEPLVEQLKRSGIIGFYIDIYSHEAKIHNFATGSKDAFREALIGLKNVIATGFDLIVKVPLIIENLKALDKTVEFLGDLGAKKIQIFYPESLPEEYAVLERYVPKIPDAVPHLSKALAKMAELEILLVPRFTPFSMKFYNSSWVKRGRKTGKKEGHELLFDNRKNINKKPAMSVIIPTFNRSKILENTLTSLFNQTLPTEQFEVIVVDDGSTDDTSEMITRLNPPFRLRYFLQDDLGYGPGRARNIGTLYANGEIMLYLDSDVICDPKNLEEHMRSHAFYKKKYNHDAVVIGKRLDMHTNTEIQATLNPEIILNDFDQIKRIPSRVDMREDFFKWCEDRPSNFHAPWHMIYTNNLSVRRKHMLGAGLIDESFVFWSIEDQELGYRLQWLRFVLNPQAKGYHQHHPVVYSSKDGMDKALKYNARIFYKKFVDPSLYEVYKPWIHQKKCTIQVNDATINDSVFFKYLGKKPGKERSLEEVKQQLELFTGEGDKLVTFVGGNPLLHPDIKEMIKSAKGFRHIGIDTEAESLTNLKDCIDLVKLGVDRFTINLSGANPGHHDILMNKKGSFDAALKAIQNLILLNQGLKVRLLISRLNFASLEETVALLHQFGVKRIELNLPLSQDPNKYMFDETSLPLSGTLYYYALGSLKLAKKLKIKVTTVNIFSEFLALNMNVFLRMYDLFGKPYAVSRNDLR